MRNATGIWMIFCGLFLAGWNSSASESGTAERIVLRNFKPGDWEINPATVRVSADGRSLTFDSLASKEEWSWGLRSRALQPGRRYKARFRYRADAATSGQGYLLLICRSLSTGDASRDTMWDTYSESPVGGWVEVTFQTGFPARDSAFQIHANRKIRGKISNFTLTECKSPRYVPAVRDAKEWRGNIPQIPTGAVEFEVKRPEGLGQNVSAADFGVSPDLPDNGPALNRALEFCRKTGARRLTLPNATLRIRKTPINLLQMKDFELDGNHASLLVLKENPDTATFLIQDCERLALRNFSLDWDWKADPLANRVTVVGKSADSVDVRFRPGRAMGRRRFPLSSVTGYDRDGRFGDIRFLLALWGPTSQLRREWISDDVCRLWLPTERLYVGQSLLLHHYYYLGSGFAMQSNRHLTLEDIQIHANKGHLFTVEGDQQYWQYRRVRVVPPPSEPDRELVVTADTMHVVKSRGFLKIEDCEFSLSADDFMNFHDTSNFCRRTGPKRVSVSGIPNYEPGDPVELRHEDYFPTGVTARVVAVEKTARNYDLILDCAVPEPKRKGDGFVLFNRRFDTRNIIVRNNDFHDCRNRGILILARDVTIENNRFRNLGIGGLNLETGYTFLLWSEGYGVKNVVVRKNLFDTVNPSRALRDGLERDISIGVYRKTDPGTSFAGYPILSGMLFENNLFRNSSGLIAYISSAENVIFRNNRFENPGPFPVESPRRAGFYVTHAKNVTIVNNRWVASPEVPAPGVYADSGGVRNLVCGGNRVIPDQASSTSAK